MRKLVLASALTISLPLGAVAQSNQPPGTAQPSNEMSQPGTGGDQNGMDVDQSAVAAPSTEDFADQAMVVNTYEIEAAKIAQQKTDKDKVDQYAKMILEDHQKALDQLKSAISGVNGLTVPTSLDQPHVSMIEHLKLVTGDQFLGAFKLQQVEGHKQAILLMQAYANGGDNGQLQDLAKKTIPVLKKHLQAAVQLPPAPGRPALTEGSEISAAPPANGSQAKQ